MITAIAIPTHVHAFPVRPGSVPLKLELARLTVSVAVPEVIEHLQFFYGPNSCQRRAAHDYIQRAPLLADSLLFASRYGTVQQMRWLCEVVAILAFCPGGISVLGLRFEAEKDAVAR